MKTNRYKVAVAGIVWALLASQGAAQTSPQHKAQGPSTPQPSSGTPATAATPSPAPAANTTLTGAHGTLVRLSRPITVELTEQRLEAVIEFIATMTDATIEPLWAASGAEGLNRDTPITLKVVNRPALDVLEQVLAKAQGDFGSNTWQLTTYGALEIGPKDLLNKHKRVELYDIHDLLFVIPNYTEVPQIDLQGLLQQSQGGGGGGGQSPFRDQQQNRVRTPEQIQMDIDTRTTALVSLITSLIENEQWADNGGEGGTIRAFQGNIIVNAPDYMHRQINGYKFWPASYTAKVVEGKRYVSLNMDASEGKIDGVRNFPVTAAVPGRPPQRSDPGGSAAPNDAKPDRKKIEPKK